MTIGGTCWMHKGTHETVTNLGSMTSSGKLGMTVRRKVLYSRVYYCNVTVTHWALQEEVGILELTLTSVFASSVHACLAPWSVSNSDLICILPVWHKRVPMRMRQMFCSRNQEQSMARLIRLQDGTSWTRRLFDHLCIGYLEADGPSCR